MNMFKVNNKFAKCCWSVLSGVTIINIRVFLHCSGLSSVKFEQVTVSWVH